MNDQEVEKEIQAKGLDKAPRIQIEDVEAAIASEHYFTAAQALPDELLPVGGPLDRLTYCVLVLRNGFTITGINAGPVSAANFDAELGRKMARSAAVGQIWPYLGYELATRLSQGAQA